MHSQIGAKLRQGPTRSAHPRAMLDRPFERVIISRGELSTPVTHVCAVPCYARPAARNDGHADAARGHRHRTDASAVARVGPGGRAGCIRRSRDSAVALPVDDRAGGRRLGWLLAERWAMRPTRRGPWLTRATTAPTTAACGSRRGLLPGFGRRPSYGTRMDPGATLFRRGLTVGGTRSRRSVRMWSTKRSGTSTVGMSASGNAPTAELTGQTWTIP